MQTSWLPKFPCFHILPGCGASLSGIVCVWETGFQFMIKLLVFITKMFRLTKQFCASLGTGNPVSKLIK